MTNLKSKPIIGLVLLAIALVLAFFLGGKQLLAGSQPTNLGVHDGKLLSCPATPNCVNSQANDPTHRIAALALAKDPALTMTALQRVVQGMPRSKTIEATDNYLYVQFTSQLMGFVDDVEFLVDGRAVQVRSASRLGESDLGVNRQRIEEIRSELSKINAPSNRSGQTHTP
jgi:uncharacterized protein (DUF1499 family)